ncbi:MAG: hypothetical protein ACI93R_003058 [Flavobacteriales bacterium]|jgi:hypothetical protein
MATEKYNLVFKGELVRGADLVDSKKKVQGLFKVSSAQVETLFSGKSVVLKKNLDFATATKYRVAIKKAGCRVDIVEHEEPSTPSPTDQETFKDKPNKVPTPEQKSPVSTKIISRPEMSSSGPSDLSSSRGAVGGNAFSYQQDITAPAYNMAPAGTELLADSEKKTVTPIRVDTSAYTVKAMVGDLLEANEKPVFESREFDFSEIDLAEAGADLLLAHEKTEKEVKDVVVPGFSIAEPGAQLSKNKEELNIPVPDTSGLSLDEP